MLAFKLLNFKHNQLKLDLGMKFGNRLFFLQMGISVLFISSALAVEIHPDPDRSCAISAVGSALAIGSIRATMDSDQAKKVGAIMRSGPNDVVIGAAIRMDEYDHMIMTSNGLCPLNLREIGNLPIVIDIKCDNLTTTVIFQEHYVWRYKFLNVNPTQEELAAISSDRIEIRSLPYTRGFDDLKPQIDRYLDRLLAEARFHQRSADNDELESEKRLAANQSLNRIRNSLRWDSQKCSGIADQAILERIGSFLDEVP